MARFLPILACLPLLVAASNKSGSLRRVSVSSMVLMLPCLLVCHVPPVIRSKLPAMSAKQKRLLSISIRFCTQSTPPLW